VVVFGLLATRRASNNRHTSKNPSLASQYHYVDPKTARPPES
jgi:hypothetical protein